MDATEPKEEHLDQAIALAMGGETPAVGPLGVDPPSFVPIHDRDESPRDCRGAEASKTVADASPEELTRHAQFLEWQAGRLTGEAAALRAVAASR